MRWHGAAPSAISGPPQARLLDASQRSLTLADREYRAGVSAYLNVLTAQRTLYSAKQTAIATLLADLSNRVTLYAALGADFT